MSEGQLKAISVLASSGLGFSIGLAALFAPPFSFIFIVSGLVSYLLDSWTDWQRAYWKGFAAGSREHTEVSS